MTLKRLIGIFLALVCLGAAGVGVFLVTLTAGLPQMITVQDYQPLLVSEVYDRNNKKVGEFFREKRTLTPLEQIPKVLVNAFLAAEDDKFYQHGGIDYLAIVRAGLANFRAGAKVQGASTITQQTARTLLLSSEKTYTRKIKEILLAYRMEQNLSKDEILYLYLNQIYLGQGAYGVEEAAKVYFRKPLKDVTMAEAAMLAGLPKAPSAFSPIHNPQRARERQTYVLRRMAEEKFVAQEDAARAAAEPLKVFIRRNYQEMAPFYLETIRTMLVEKLGESTVLDKGIKVYAALDGAVQEAAQRQVQVGLRDVDKRQGFRGATKNLTDANEVARFLLTERDRALRESEDFRTITGDGTEPERPPLNLTGKGPDGATLPNLPLYIKPDQLIEGIVTDVNDRWGLVTVRFAESRGLIDIEDMKWARKPDPEVAAQFGEIKKPSEALKKGDVIQLRVVAAKFTSDRLSKELSDLKKAAGKKKWERPVDVPDFDAFAEVALEQEPLVEGGLLAIDNASGDLLAMVGGYDFARSQFNRTLQALRQTGSSFKVFVYTAALDKGYSPATPITDAPLVFEEEGQGVPLAPDGSAAARPVGAGRGAGAKVAAKPGSSEEPGASEAKVWKPGNYSERFVGDILFRNALIRSLNIPTVKITEKIGLDTVALYARRLGVFSPLNMDFTLALGSSGTTLYEMTKAFAVLARQGRNVHPTLIKKVTDRDGNVLLENLTMDDRFRSEIDVVENEFELYRQAYLDFKQRLASGEDESRVRTDLRTRLQAAGIKSHLDIAKHPPIYFEDKEQLMSPQTAYVITSILQGVVDEPLGTGAAARSVGRPVAAKTGTTSGYFDAWFIGYSPDITSGVWVGYDQERSLGRGETGGRAAIPIWTEFMKASHGANASRSFTAPEGVVFLNIDNDTGRPASATSRNFVRQAFTEGTEPSAEADKARLLEDDKDFFKQDLSQ